MLAACTCTASNKPSVSVTMWRFRPFTFLPASNPHGPPLSVVFTLWLSMIPAEGVRLRPSARRVRATSTRFIRRQPPMTELADPGVNPVTGKEGKGTAEGEDVLALDSTVYEELKAAAIAAKSRSGSTDLL